MLVRDKLKPRSARSQTCPKCSSFHAFLQCPRFSDIAKLYQKMLSCGTVLVIGQPHTVAFLLPGKAGRFIPFGGIGECAYVVDRTKRTDTFYFDYSFIEILKFHLKMKMRIKNERKMPSKFVRRSLDLAEKPPVSGPTLNWHL